MYKSLVIYSDDAELTSFCSRVLRPFFSDISIQALPDPALILLDFAKISSDGFDVLERLVQKNERAPVIVVSRARYPQLAVRCMKSGAADFIEFPCREETLTRKALPYFQPAPLTESADDCDDSADFAALIGVSPAIRRIKRQLTRIARSDLPVLLLGESGTGKTVMAKLIHEHSPRSAGPYCELNVGALNDQLADSELFGTVPGAYTGAVNRIGFFEKAHQGSLFLDEIGDLAPAVQVKLLHAVEHGVFRRLGSIEEKHSDVRIISATNVNLDESMRQKLFREDLYFRLAVLQVCIPPLRERIEDIPLLAARFAADQGKKLSAAAMKILCAFSWPGNVRQLHNCVLRACFMSGSELIETVSSDFF